MIEKTLKADDLLMKNLELKTINRLICTTDKGVLSLQIRKGEQNYHLCLDSVPLNKELNKTLMDLLFPVSKVEIPIVNKKPEATISFKIPSNTGITPKEVIITKKGGRPKGSKNK